jgi:nitroimidazol reductase NimA-like FMN-containing flavoprotein (pyridoxamine 5'-phosphate oxidase superfamily)
MSRKTDGHGKYEYKNVTDTGLVVELEHLKTKTRLIDEKFSSVRGECET